MDEAATRAVQRAVHVAANQNSGRRLIAANRSARLVADEPATDSFRSAAPLEKSWIVWPPFCRGVHVHFHSTDIASGTRKVAKPRKGYQYM